MSRKILAKIIAGNIWECQLCEGPDLRRIREVTSMMIHLVQIHKIGLELQAFPPGTLQEGAIFHVTAKTTPETYEELFTAPLTVRDK